MCRFRYWCMLEFSVPVYELFFFFNDTATTEIYTLSLHDALPIWARRREMACGARFHRRGRPSLARGGVSASVRPRPRVRVKDRKSTRLNSSHANISYAVFCLKKKKYYITQREHYISTAHILIKLT